ncbi:MAG: hypothetical protein ABL921_02280, partial [Pirellula sp.]
MQQTTPNKRRGPSFSGRWRFETGSGWLTVAQFSECSILNIPISFGSRDLVPIGTTDAYPFLIFLSHNLPVDPHELRV